MPSFFESEKQLTQNTLRRLLDRFPGVAKLTSNIPESTELPQNDLPGTVSLEGGDVVNDTVAEPVGASHQSEEISRVFRNGALELTRRREIPTGSEITLDLTTPAGPIVIRGEKDRKTVELVSFWRVSGENEQDAQKQIDNSSYAVQTDQTEGKLTVTAVIPDRNIITGTNNVQIIRGDANIIVTNNSIQSGSIGFELRVPKGAMVERLITSYGDVVVSQIDGEVAAESRYGNLTIKDIGAVSLKTGYGDVLLQHANGNAFVETRSGNVSVDTINGALKAGSDYGDVKVAGVANGALLRTKSGNISATTIGADLEAWTGSGYVYASKVNGKATLESRSGSIVAGDVKSDTKGSTKYGDVTIKNVGGVVKAISGHGNITIENAVAAQAETNYGNVRTILIRDDVSIMTRSGHIVIENVGGNTDAETRYGLIRFQPQRNNVRVQAHTNYGDIRTKVELHSVRRRTQKDLDADLGPNPAYLATLETRGGDITIS